MRQDISRHLIFDNATLKDALVALNNLSGGIMTLFVIDKEQRMVGLVLGAWTFLAGSSDSASLTR